MGQVSIINIMKAFDLESLCRLRAIRVHNVTTPVIISKITSSYPELLAVCKPNALKLASSAPPKPPDPPTPAATPLPLESQPPRTYIPY
jgi:hypothetical protein